MGILECMQQVVIKGRTYLNAYFVAKAFGYAPAYLRELYDTEEVAGVFWKNSLFLDAVSWQAYVDTHGENRTASARHAVAVAAGAATPTTDEHHYLHHAKTRQSKYERDPSDLIPQPKKAADSAANATTSEDAEVDTKTTTTSTMRVPVTLADAEAVRVQTIGPTSTDYAAAERPSVRYQGKLSVEAVLDDDTAEEMVEAASPDSPAAAVAVSSHTSHPEVVNDPEPEATDEAGDTAATPTTHTGVIGRFRLLIVSQTVQRSLVGLLVMVIGLGLCSLLLMEQYIVAGTEGMESSWRLSLQAASLWFLE